MIEFFATWFLIFMIYSFLGWIMEVAASVFARHKFVNRGFLVGPICPIYGAGALFAALLLNGHENVAVIFCVSVVGAALLEYLTSYFMEKLFRVRWWDYSEKKFNLNGRICLNMLVVFGIFGIIVVKFTTPFFLHVLSLLPRWTLLIVAGTTFIWLLADFILSLWLILDVRVTVGTVQRDATDEIAERVQEILMGKGRLTRRLAKSFPGQKPSDKLARPRRSRSGRRQSS